MDVIYVEFSFDQTSHSTQTDADKTQTTPVLYSTAIPHCNQSLFGAVCCLKALLIKMNMAFAMCPG